MAEIVAPRPGKLAGAFLGLLFTAAVWGSAVPFTAVLLRYFDPLVVAALRAMLSVPALALVVAWREPGPLLAISMGWRRFLLLGLFMAAFNAFYTFGILFSNPVTAAAIMVTMPLVGGLTAKVMTGAPLEKGFGLALALSLAGGALLVHGQPNFDVNSLGLRGGELLMLGAMVAWNVYSIKAQAWLGGASQTRLTLLTSTAASLWLAAGCVVLAVLGLGRLPVEWPGLGPAMMLLYLGLFSAAVGNFLWNYGVSIIGVPVATLYINLTPAFAVLIGTAFGIFPTVEQLLGGLVVLAGIVSLQWRKLRRPAG